MKHKEGLADKGSLSKYLKEEKRRNVSGNFQGSPYMKTS